SPPSRTTGCALKLNEIKYIRGRSFASVSTSFRGVPSEMVAASSGNSTLSRAYSNASECARVCLTNTNRRSVSDRKLRAWSFRRRRDLTRMPRSARAGFVFSRLEICCRSSADKCSQSRWNGNFTGARIRRLSAIAGVFEQHQQTFHFDDASIPLIYLLLFLGAIARTFSWAARSSFFPTLVPRDAFSNAVTWNNSIFQIGSVVGPAISGFVVA